VPRSAGLKLWPLAGAEPRDSNSSRIFHLRSMYKYSKPGEEMSLSSSAAAGNSLVGLQSECSTRRPGGVGASTGSGQP
jgi:hypothetical protein